MEDMIVELKNITKIFPGVMALDGMSIQLKPGEVHGLIGENGAGKSTLIKTLTGVNIPDKGEIVFEGKPVRFSGPLDAKKKGIACVYQELNIVKELSITDNMFIGNPVRIAHTPFLDYRYMNAKAKEIMAEIGQDIDPEMECGKLGIGMQQMVEIGKSILLDCKVLILDEPTASLGAQEAKELFKTVRKMKERGVAILFVSHKLEEIFELCDLVTVMRDAKHIITCPSADLTKDSLIAHMVGRTLENLFPKERCEIGEVYLEVKGLTRRGVYQDISFTARRGEILGFSGLVGAGRTEVFRGVFAADPVDGGEVIIDGRRVVINKPRDAIKNKVAFLTEDRKGQGLVLMQTIQDNIALVNLGTLRKGLFIDNKSVMNQAKDT